MFKRIAVVGVPARDVLRAVQFYRDVLGLPMWPAPEGHAGPPHFRVGEMFLAVFASHPPAAEHPTPLIAFEVQDIQTAMSALTAHGVVFDGVVHQARDAAWTAFRDSEGNLLELLQFVHSPG